MAGYWMELAQKMAEEARVRVAEERKRLESVRSAAQTKSPLQPALRRHGESSLLHLHCRRKWFQ
jgi:hypothetical protein